MDMQTVRGGPPQQSSSGISSPSGQLGHVVAEHYNKLKETGLTERSKSRIFYMRNFNNWIKSMILSDAVETLERKGTPSHKLHVLDIGCGKGGDLLKWQKHGISHLICTDLADASLEHCRQRYADLQRRSGNRERTFTAEFFQADSTKEVIQEKFKDPNMSVDITSIQFSFHYCFESLSQANMMLKNAAKSLRPGGLLILTMPDCADIMSRWQESGSEEFGNEVYKIRFDSKPKPLPLFGAKYFFSLEEVVNCPEFLVHFPTLKRLANRHGLRLLYRKRFHELFRENKTDGRQLLGRMQALETYPPFEGERAQGNPESYQHARDWIGKTSEGGKDDSSVRVGTLSKDEWEAISLYIGVAFEKMSKDEQQKERTESDEEIRQHLKRSSTTEECSPRVKRPRTEEEEEKHAEAEEEEEHAEAEEEEEHAEAEEEEEHAEAEGSDLE